MEGTCTCARQDSLYTVSAGVSATLSARLQFTANILSVYKNRPPTTATKRNDVAVTTGLAVIF